jgi:hypothetical protein
VNGTSDIERVWRLDHNVLMPMIERVVTVYVKHGGRLKMTAQEVNLSLADLGWLRRRPEWEALVKKAERERLERLQFDADDALRMLIEVALADPADCFDPETNLLLDLHEIPPATRRAIKTYDRANNKVVMMDKGTAQTILANKFGHNIQRHEHKGVDPVEILYNSLPPHLRPPGLERRGIRVWDVETTLVRDALPAPGGSP